MTYMLRVLLKSKNITLYQLEKSSHVSHATLNDIYNERCNIDNWSIVVISKIAKSFNMKIDTLYEYLSYQNLSLIKYNDDFDLFKSNTLQRLKRMNEKDFINNVVTSQDIENYDKNNEKEKALYLLSLLDYLCDKNHLSRYEQYNDLRNERLDKLYVPKSIYLLIQKRIIKINDVIKECIPTFLEHNIVDSEIDRVI